MRARVLHPTRFLDNISIAVGAAQPLPSGAAPLLGARRTAFRPAESLVVTTGAMAAGGMAGFLLLFMLGRIAPWALLSTAIAVYCCAIYLVALSLRDVVHTRSALPIALFGVHFSALLVWPLLTTEWTSASWQWWLGLPVSLLALIAFLTLPRVPSSVVYRSGAHVSLIACIAVYEYLWRVLGG